LSQKKPTVELDVSVPDEKLKAAVEDMGYDVIAIREND
jgi:copper chaperone CopZ